MAMRPGSEAAVRWAVTRDSESDVYAEVSDRDLAAAALRDDAAFAALYARYAPAVFRYLLTYVELREDAADLTQMVFLRCLEALPRYQYRGIPFRAWLFRIARNAACDAYRRRRRVLPWEHVPPQLLPRTDDDPEAVALRREALNDLRVLVAGLDATQQELLALRFAGQLTVREIADVLGKSEGAVQQAIRRLVLALREQSHE
jgi:RNA polymerase sigma-70 factor (ECF subfamily)